MSYLYTGSSSGANISTGLSTQFIIEVNNQRVGAIQSFRPRHNRPVRIVGEVGSDGPIEKTVNGPTDITIDVDRIVFDRLNLPGAFARAYKNIAAQRVPFDIKVYDKSNVSTPADDGDIDVSGEGIVTDVYKNCWFTSYSTSYTAGDYIITENASISCEYVRSFQGQNQNAQDGGMRGIIADNRGGNIELLADLGRRGSLDAAGLARLLTITT